MTAKLRVGYAICLRRGTGRAEAGWDGTTWRSDFYAKVYTSQRTAKKVLFGMVIHAPELIGRVYLRHVGKRVASICRKLRSISSNPRLNPDSFS